MNDKLNEQLKMINDIFKQNNIELIEYREISYGLQIKFFYDNTVLILRIYTNKKDEVKYDYSQISDSKSEIIKNIIEKNNIKYFEYDDYVGSDESGKGDYFGPLIVCGVKIDKYNQKELFDIGVKDSKLLSDKDNCELSRKIFDIIQGKYAIIELSPRKYNELYKQLTHENKNLNTLLAWGHARAIEDILKVSSCELAIADQFADENFIINKLQQRGKKIKLIQTTKGERYIGVAAASIIARARFLKRIDEMSTKYKINIPKGASEEVIETGKRLIKLYGTEILSDVAKTHFVTTSKIVNN